MASQSDRIEDIELQRSFAREVSEELNMLEPSLEMNERLLLDALATAGLCLTVDTANVAGLSFFDSLEVR